VPADPALVEAWVKSRMPKTIPPDARSIDEIQEEVFESIGQVEEVKPALLVFQKNEGHLVMRAGTIKAHIKDCARILSVHYIGKPVIKAAPGKKEVKERAFSTKVINAIYQDEKVYWVPVLRGGIPIEKADGSMDKGVRVWGPGGPRSILKCFEWVDRPTMIFTIKILGDSVKQADLETIFMYGGVHGYGGERGDGEGRYEFNVERIEKEVGDGKRQQPGQPDTVENDRRPESGVGIDL